MEKNNQPQGASPLTFRRSSSPSPAPHAPIQRIMIPSPAGELEMLYAQPEYPTEKHLMPPLFFVHGGFGCAAVWTEYMTFLSSSPYNIPCYSISLRGHGASWCPSYLRMVYGTSKRSLADDIVTGIEYVQKTEQERKQGNSELTEPIRVLLVAHSNGGGLAQLALDAGDVQVRGLALLDSAPNFGVLGMYWNWFKLDPWSGLRFNWHLGHPRSPLSCTELVKRAFFSKQMPDCLVRRFEFIMSPFESLLWPLGFFWRFVSVKRVLQNVLGFDKRPGILIMAAEQSKLLGPRLMSLMADEYREGVDKRVSPNSGLTDEEMNPNHPDLRLHDVRGRVWYHEVKGAGHHLQNDVQWEDGAAHLAKFYRANCSHAALIG